jgi:putative ABC transport system substrate-binding protein
LALRALGYVEGQNIIIEYQYAEGKRGREAELAAELVRLKVDVIVVSGGDAWIRAAMNATKTIPIVLEGQGPDPVKAGFIESLARPGGNVTGITSLNNELGGKRLEVLKEGISRISRVAVLHAAANPPAERELKEDLPAAARALKLTLRTWAVHTDGLEKVFAALRKERPDGLYVRSGGAMIRANYNQITSFAIKNRLPAIYSGREAIDAGGLMYYGADRAESPQLVAWYVDKILTGRKPAELPVQQPMRFEFVINLQTANKIGVTINTDVLARATKIIR